MTHNGWTTGRSDMPDRTVGETFGQYARQEAARMFLKCTLVVLERLVFQF